MGLKGKEERWTDLVVLMCLLQQVCPHCYSRVQREQELNHDCSFCSRSWVPAGLLNTKMKFHTVSLEWKQHDVSGTVCWGKHDWKERTADSRGWADLPLLLHCMGLFSALQLRPSCGSRNTSPRLWAGKWTNCKEVVHSSWNSFTSCGKWKLRLNRKTSWKH